MAELTLTGTPFLLYPVTGKQAVIVNRDAENDIAIGSEQGIYSFQPSGLEGGQLTDPSITIISAAGGQMVVDGTWAVWGVAIPLLDNNGNIIDTTADVSVTAGSTSLLPGANETAAALISSGFITAMATALQQALATGAISLLANPVQLYNTGQNSPAQPGVVVGATTVIGAGAYGTPRSVAANTFDGFVGRTMANAAQKWYLEEGEHWPFSGPTGTSADYTALKAQGAKIVLCVKPLRSAVTAGGSALAAEQAALANDLANATPAQVILWNEPDQKKNQYFTDTGGVGVPSYAQYWTAFQPTVKAAAIPCYYCPLLFEIGLANTMFPNVVGKIPDGIYCDWYGQDFINNRNPDTVINGSSLVSIAAANLIPLGIGEWGESAEGIAIPISTLQAMANKLISIMQGQINAGRNSAFAMWYSAGKTGGPNFVSGTNDPKVPVLQSVSDALIGQPATAAFTVNANTIKTVPPLPSVTSPGAGFAVANGLSYEVVLNLIAGVGSTIPFANILVGWHPLDQSGAHIADSQHWSVPMGTNGTIGTFIIGRGPETSEFMNLKISNLDSVPLTATVTVLQTGRNENRHDWYWDAQNSVTVPGFTLAPDEPQFANILANVNGRSVPANGSLVYLCSMRAGQVYLKASAGGTSQLQFTLAPVPATVFGANAIWNTTNPASGSVEDVIVLPRAPMLLTITNTSGAAVNAFFYMTSRDQ